MEQLIGVKLSLPKDWYYACEARAIERETTVGNVVLEMLNNIEEATKCFSELAEEYEDKIYANHPEYQEEIENSSE